MSTHILLIIKTILSKNWNKGKSIVKNNIESLLLMFILFFPIMGIQGQVAINMDNSTADPSAILDVKSTTKGMLIPRMTAAQRNAINAPATGLMVFSTTDGHFYFYTGTDWKQMNSNSSIQDQDNDTKIQVEESTDEDIIRFDISGIERLKMGLTTNGLLGISIPANSNNLLIGEGAGQNNISSGVRNHFIGYQAGNNNSTGDDNTFIGYQAGYSNVTRDRSVFIGYKAGYSNQNGFENVFIGDLAGTNNTGGFQNCFIGAEAGRYINNGSNNVFMGHEAGRSSNGGNYNIYIGNSAGRDSDGSDNVMIGNNAGGSLNHSGNNNVYLGSYAGWDNQTGSNNTFAGYEAGRESTGSNNVFIGYQAGYNETGDNKLYIENSSSSTPLIYGEFDNDLLRINGTLNINNAYSLPTNSGSNGQYLMTDGSGNATWSTFNTDNLGNHTATQNIRLNGHWLSNDGGNEGVFVTTSGKVGVGTNNPDFQFHVKDNAASDYVAIIENTNGGAYSNGLVVKAGQNSQSVNNRFITFSRPDGTEIGAVRQINSSYVDFWRPSDRRLKTNIRPTQYGLHNLMEIQVMDYVYKDDPDKLSTGFIAQQLYEHYPEAVVVGSDDLKKDPWMVSYGSLTPLLVQSIQDQQSQLDDLTSGNEKLRQDIDALQSEINKIQKLEEMIMQLKAQMDGAEESAESQK